jgi:hypothetical protein
MIAINKTEKPTTKPTTRPVFEVDGEEEVYTPCAVIDEDRTV